METVRDRLWIFTCVAGSDNDSLTQAGYTQGSRMTPAEGALFLDVPNLHMIRWRGLPAYPYEQYAVTFSSLKQVTWSIVGSGGQVEGDELQRVIELAERHPNVGGVYLDDFMRKEGRGALSVDDLANIRPRLGVAGRRLDLWVVLYIKQLDLPVAPYLEYCDVVNLWTWNSDDLENLEQNMERLEAMNPGGRVSLGCYLWDFHNQRPVSIPHMEHQCGLGLQWLREGRIESIVFLANTTCDIGIESAPWAQAWIRKVGDMSLEAVEG